MEQLHNTAGTHGIKFAQILIGILKHFIRTNTAFQACATSNLTLLEVLLLQEQHSFACGFTVVSIYNKLHGHKQAFHEKLFNPLS